MPDSGSPPLSRLGIAAVAYAHQGWPVEPLHSAPGGRCSCGNPGCPSPGKHPRTAKGFLDATQDIGTVSAWWRQWPDANIGMMPGAAGYLVIDVDGPVGAQAAMRLGLFAEPTLEVETGRPDGGRHRYYRHPPGVEIGNAKLADHLDVRADKGYVLLPPSVHPSGRAYRWHGRLEEVTELPAPIVAQLIGVANGQRPNGAKPDQLPAWMLPWLEVGEGGRNNTLTRFVGWAYHAGHDETTVLAMALGVNSRYRPPLEADEVEAIVRSIGTIEGRKTALPAVVTAPPPEVATRASRFHVLAWDDVEALPDPLYLVDGFLPAGVLGVLYGPPGEGKTFLLLDLAASIAAEREHWCGQRVCLWGPVVYVCAEGLAQLKRRLTAWRHEHEVAKMPPVHFIGEPVQLFDQTDTAALVTAIRVATTTTPPVLILIDTLFRCIPGADENSVKDMSVVIANLDYLRRETGATVLVAHHSQKQGPLERGSSAIRGAADLMLRLTNEDGVLTLESTKVKDGQALDRCHLRMAPVLESLVLRVVRDDATPFGRITKSQREALESLDRISLSEGVTSSEWMDSCDTSRRAFFRARKKLIEGGYVNEVKGRRYAVTTRGHDALVPGAN